MDSSLDESMIAVAGTHCDVWVLVHLSNVPVIKAFHVTASGVDAVPVISNCGNFQYSYGSPGSMKVSPDRKRLVVCSFMGGVELCNFDPATGVASNARGLSNNDADTTNKPVTTYFSYQACFSPDNTKLYVNTSNTVYYGYILQFDLNDTTLQTTSIVNMDASVSQTDVQLAPDGKIYFFHHDFSTDADVAIDCIENPNLPTPACNYKPYAIGLYPGSVVYMGLHNMYVKPLRGTVTYVGHPDTGICAPGMDSIALYAPAGYNHYIWSTGSTAPVLYASNTATFILRSDNSCDVRYDTFSVKKVNDVFSLGPDSVYCTQSVVLSVPVQNAQYLWQDGSTASSYKVYTSGTYSVVVSELGCVHADTVQIGINDVQQALGDDTTLCSNDRAIQLTLNANVPAGGQVMWNTGSVIPTITAGAGTYWVTVTDGACVGTDTISIYAQNCNCKATVPDAFTPNGDGKNDVLHTLFENGCPVSEYVMRIYNRWGNMVFYSNDLNNGWDGTYHGVPADAGTYMYELQFILGTNKGNTLHKKGDVVLVRLAFEHYTNCNKYPRIAPPNTMKAVFSFLKNMATTKPAMAIVIPRQSWMESLPSSTHTANIMATDATFTVSRKADIIADLLSLGMYGLSKATNKNEGRKMPTVAAMAPGSPAICQPINVAAEKTGPGVNWPTAIASINSLCEIIPVLTSSLSRKANKT